MRTRLTIITAAALALHCGLLAGCGKVEGKVASQIAQQARAARTPGTTAQPDHAQTLEGVTSAYNIVLRNLANAQTPGYQAVRPIFEMAGRDASARRGVMRPVMHRDTSPGRPIPTGRWLDVAIEGNGYFIVDDPEAGGIDGLAYSRAGRLYVNRDGALVLGSFDGPRLEPTVVFPDEYSDIRVDPTGIVSVLPADKSVWVAVGMIHLARFANEAGLSPSLTGRYITSAESGPPLVDTPGGLGLGTLKYKHLEGSNVDVVAELTELNQLKEWGEALGGALGVEAQFAAEPATAARWLQEAAATHTSATPRPLADAQPRETW